MPTALRLRRIFPLALPVLAVAAGLSWGGQAWLLAVPTMFLLGRSYGSQTHAQPPRASYGVGAALAGFTPGDRR